MAPHPALKVELQEAAENAAEISCLQLVDISSSSVSSNIGITLNGGGAVRVRVLSRYFPEIRYIF